jgi:hypothetical protein
LLGAIKPPSQILKIEGDAGIVLIRDALPCFAVNPFGSMPFSEARKSVYIKVVSFDGSPDLRKIPRLLA